MDNYVISVFFLLCFYVCLLIALWSPAGKELTSWLSVWTSNCAVVTFPWYPGPGEVLDCIYSSSLPSFLLSCRGSVYA